MRIGTLSEVRAPFARSFVRGGVRSFAETVASWYDGGAPGRFVPTFRDWQTSGALWVDSNTPLTALEQAVWMNLDRSRNLARSGELVANGDFSSATGWAVTGAGAAITGGQGVFTAAATGAGFSQGIAIAGKTYEVVYTVVSVSAGAVRAYAGSGGIGTNRTAPGTYREIIVASGTNLMSLTAIGTTTAVVDNVSFKEIPGAHRIQPTSTARPILTARKNQFVNSAFLGGGSAPTGWVASLATGTATPNGVVDGNTVYRFAANLERPYFQTATALPLVGTGSVSLSASVGSIYSGSISVQRAIFCNTAVSTTVLYFVDGASVPGGTLVTPNTRITAVISFTGASGTANYRIGAGATGNDTVDLDISRPMLTLGGMDQVGRYQRTGLSPQTGDYDAVGFPVGLRYDGIDDCMYTAAPIDYSGTDKVEVVYPIRKESDASRGVLVEHSATASNPGVFNMEAPFTTSTGSLRFSANAQVGNATPASCTATGLTAPVSVVMGMSVDLSQAAATDQVKPRVNGIPVTTGFTGNANGPANFTSQVNYEGARGNTSTRFVGLAFGEFQIGMLRTVDERAYVDVEFAKTLSEAL